MFLLLPPTTSLCGCDLDRCMLHYLKWIVIGFSISRRYCEAYYQRRRIFSLGVWWHLGCVDKPRSCRLRKNCDCREKSTRNGNWNQVHFHGSGNHLMSLRATRIYMYLSNCDPITLHFQICEELMTRCLAPDCQMGGLGCDNMTVLLVCFLNGSSYDDLCERCSRPKDSAEETG